MPCPELLQGTCWELVTNEREHRPQWWVITLQYRGFCGGWSMLTASGEAARNSTFHKWSEGDLTRDREMRAMASCLTESRTATFFIWPREVRTT